MGIVTISKTTPFQKFSMNLLNQKYQKTSFFFTRCRWNIKACSQYHLVPVLLKHSMLPLLLLIYNRSFVLSANSQIWVWSVQISIASSSSFVVVLFGFQKWVWLVQISVISSSSKTCRKFLFCLACKNGCGAPWIGRHGCPELACMGAPNWHAWVPRIGR